MQSPPLFESPDNCDASSTAWKRINGILHFLLLLMLDLVLMRLSEARPTTGWRLSWSCTTSRSRHVLCFFMYLENMRKYRQEANIQNFCLYHHDEKMIKSLTPGNSSPGLVPAAASSWWPPASCLFCPPCNTWRGSSHWMTC